MGYADLIALGGAYAVKVTGGPDIPIKIGEASKTDLDQRVLDSAAKLAKCNLECAFVVGRITPCPSERTVYSTYATHLQTGHLVFNLLCPIIAHCLLVSGPTCLLYPRGFVLNGVSAAC